MACFPFYAELEKVFATVTYAGNFYGRRPLPTPVLHVLEFHFLLDNTLMLTVFAFTLQPFLQLASVCSP